MNHNLRGRLVLEASRDLGRLKGSPRQVIGPSGKQHVWFEINTNGGDDQCWRTERPIGWLVFNQVNVSVCGWKWEVGHLECCAKYCSLREFELGSPRFALPVRLSLYLGKIDDDSASFGPGLLRARALVSFSGRSIMRPSRAAERGFGLASFGSRGLRASEQVGLRRAGPPL